MILKIMIKAKHNIITRNHDKSTRDQGSIILLSAVSLLVLLGFAVIALNIGRMYILRRELQTANDAAALTAAFNVMEHGLPHQAANVSQIFPQYYTWLGNVVQAYQVDRFVNRDIYTSQNRTLITTRLALQFDTQQSLFSTVRLFNINTSAQAQINENIFDLWPMIIFILDRSGAMNDPLPGDVRTAFEQLRFIMEQWRDLKLPVRSGMVLFSAGIDRVISPDADNRSSDDTIVQALYQIGPSPNLQILTDIASATMQTQALFTGLEGGKNAIIISDGEATASTHCNIGQQQTECPRREARDHGCQMRGGVWSGSTCTANPSYQRNMAPNTWAAEVRRVNYDPVSTQTLRIISGPAGGGAGAGGWFFAITDIAAIESFFNSVANSVCTFGPLRPKPGFPPTPPLRHRGTNPRFSLGGNLTPASLKSQYSQHRVYVLIRNDSTGIEKPIRYFDNIDSILDWSGFTTSFTTDDEVYVRLTRHSCQDLATLGPDGSLVIRWGDPEIVR